MPSSQRQFRFQQFSIGHDRCGMKIGTDAVLLGAWADVANCQRLLDIGTGCGVIALMMAQRTKEVQAQVDAIDVEVNAAGQAKENASCSPWANRISVKHCSVDELASSKSNCYDHCVCNPPYFENSLPSQNSRQRIARHAGQLTRNSLLSAAKKLLVPNGKLSLVLPFVQHDSIVELAKTFGFHLQRRTSVRPMPEKPFKRILLEFGAQADRLMADELTVELDRHQFSPEYEALTRKFHLRFAV